MTIQSAITMMFGLAIAATAGAAPPASNAARVVVWRPRAGGEQAFEEGYRRHLEWHRSHADPWVWHGWTLATGCRAGWFVDGSFFHAWSDFDHPVDPAGDHADNARNVEPHAAVESVVAYELVPSASHYTAAALGAPLTTFVFMRVPLEDGETLEAAASQLGDGERALLRPVSGSDEYLLLLPAGKQSELAAHGALVRQLGRAVAKARGHIASLRIETARHREELSYAPR